MRDPDLSSNSPALQHSLATIKPLHNMIEIIATICRLKSSVSLSTMNSLTNLHQNTAMASLLSARIGLPHNFKAARISHHLLTIRQFGSNLQIINHVVTY